MALPDRIPNNWLQSISVCGLWLAFFFGLGWAFLGLRRLETLASIAGGLSCFAALASSISSNELSNRSNEIILSAISARTLNDSDVAILNKKMPLGKIVVNVQYEGDEPSRRGLHLDEEYGFKFSLESAFGSTKAAKEGRLKMVPSALPTMGFNYGTDITLYVPGHKTDLTGILSDPIYKALEEMGFSVMPANHAFVDWPEHIVEIGDYDGSAYPDEYIVSVNKRPAPRLQGRPYWGVGVN